MAAPNLFIARLAQPLAAGGSETEIFLDRITTLTGETMTTSDFTLFTRGILTINPDGDGVRSYPEHVSFTAVDAGDLSVTGVVRGLSAKSNSVVTANKRYHPAGTRVAITFGTHDINDIIDYIDAEIAALTVGANTVVTGTAGEILAAGNLVYLKDDGKWWKTDADTTTTIYNVQLGIAQGSAVADGSITNGVLRKGTDANQSGLTNGQTLYASNTAGAIASTTGTNERIVGVARGTNNMYFDPDYQPNGVLKAAQAGGGDFGTPSTTNQFLTEDWYTAKSVDVQEFTANGTWTKPAYGQMALVELWGAGGGGAGGTRSASPNPGSAGGGGAYNKKWFKLSDLASTVAVTRGTGGAGGAAGGSSGSVGGTSSFGTLLYAYGGGNGVNGSNYSGGSGGGIASAGAAGVSTSASRGGLPSYPAASGGATILNSYDNLSYGGAHSVAGGNTDGGNAVYGGGGGGGESSGEGGSSLFGGAGGGGGASQASVGGTGGSYGSFVAGGGAGGAAGAAGTAGSGFGIGGGGGGGGIAPSTNAGAGGAGGTAAGGGGGGCVDTDTNSGQAGAGGAGGNGFVRVTVF